MESLRIVPIFTTEDAAWLRRNKIDVPSFWAGHGVAPQTGDALRMGGRQFIVQGRVWERDGSGTVLKLFLSDSHAESDTVFM